MINGGNKFSVLRKAIDDQGNRRRMINGGNKFSVWKKGY